MYFIPYRQLDQQRLVVSFEKVKLTNNESDQTGQIILNSMHKFQPRIHLVIVSDQWNASHGIDLQRMKHKTFVFDLTAFTAVTAYQNQLVSKLFKITKNVSFPQQQKIIINCINFSNIQIFESKIKICIFGTKIQKGFMNISLALCARNVVK